MLGARGEGESWLLRLSRGCSPSEMGGRVIFSCMEWFSASKVRSRGIMESWRNMWWMTSIFDRALP
jgi:hypothetical protein